MGRPAERIAPLPACLELRARWQRPAQHDAFGYIRLRNRGSGESDQSLREIGIRSLALRQYRWFVRHPAVEQGQKSRRSVAQRRKASSGSIKSLQQTAEEKTLEATCRKPRQIMS